MIELVKIAHIGSTQGKQGALKFYPEENLEKIIPDLEFIFLIIDGSKVPFKVKKVNQDNNPWLLHINNIDGPETAQQFTNNEVFAEKEIIGDVKVVVEETMKGFTVYSSDGNIFGTVTDIEEHPKQILLVIEWQENKFRLPFHPDLVLDLNKEEQKISYTYSDDDFNMLFS